MSVTTKISWTDATWNPVIGCSKCSPGCLNCYAEKMAVAWLGEQFGRTARERERERGR